MINIALCDDDSKFLSEFKELIKQNFSEYNCNSIVDIFDDGIRLIEKVEREDQVYDIIFLDIQMPMIDGFTVAERLRFIDNRFYLIFTTHIKLISKETFKYNAFRYINKSSLNEELSEAINDYLKKVNILSSEEEAIFTYCFNDMKKQLTIKKKEIIYLVAIKRRIHLIAKCGEYELQTYPLRQYCEQLGDDFLIVSRKYCVNMANVINIHGDYFQMVNSATICIGTTEKSKSEARLCYGKHKNRRC